MATRSRLDALRAAVMGNDRGREVEVGPEGQVILNTPTAQEVESQPEQEGQRRKGTKLSPHAFARR
jgi:hypothetical protein